VYKAVFMRDCFLLHAYLSSIGRHNGLVDAATASLSHRFISLILSCRHHLSISEERMHIFSIASYRFCDIIY
jgi:hypothetical protein